MHQADPSPAPAVVPKPARPGRPLRVGYLAPSALLDSASGAAQSLSTMLAALGRAGVHCQALSGCCFDSVHGDDLSNFLAGRGLVARGRLKGSNLLVWQGQAQGIDQVMLQVLAQRRAAMTATEEMTFRDLAADWLRRVRPDVVVTCGGLLLDLELRRMARRAGAVVAFYLANPQYQRTETFQDVDLVLTNSSSTAQLYDKRLALKSVNIGLFVDPEPLRVAQRTPAYVTFINPQAEKGVTLFLKLVERAARDCPDMRFLVVESRAKLATAMARLKLHPSLLDRVTVLPRQDDMREVYRQTRVLLMPSFWFEAAGRVLIEATANAIPVLATNRGGIPETLAGGGVLLEVPERCTTDHWQVPNDAEVEPWWLALQALWRDPQHYQLHCDRALEAATRHSLQAKAGRVLRLLHQAVLQRQQQMVAARQATAGPVAGVPGQQA